MSKCILAFLFITVGLSACGGAASKSSLPKTPPTTQSSPTQVVNNFLEALKSKDFEKAYGYVFTPFFDKEGYIHRMKNVVEDYHTNIVGYRVLGTQIFGDKAITVAELEVTSKPFDSKKEIRRKIRNQYDLIIVEDDWKITTDRCIFNCIGQEEPRG